MGNNILNNFVREIEKEHLNVYGAILRQHGEIVASHRWRGNDFVQIYSASKTFTAVAICLAESEGLLKLSDKVVDYFQEELTGKEPKYLKDMTIEDLMTMRTGHEITTLEVHYYEERIGNWVKHFLNFPLPYPPGTHFEYNNGATYMLSVILQKASGQKLRDYLMPRIFDPLQIYNPQWDSCPQGYNKGYIGLHLTTEQLSRMGQLLLNGGKWDGKQLIPEEYVTAITKKQVDNPGYWDDDEMGSGYGYQCWRNTIPNSFRLDGLYGQFCVVLPDYDAVITTTSHEEQAQNDILRVMWKTILPELEQQK